MFSVAGREFKNPSLRRLCRAAHPGQSQSDRPYTGERLNRKQAKDRDRGSYTYLFLPWTPYWTLDGAVGGSGAEIINSQLRA